MTITGLMTLSGGTYAQTEYGTRCRIAQQNLRGTVRDQDIRTRVSRFQAYQFIYKRLDVFVQRLENNNQRGAADLRQEVNQLKQAIDDFKSDYEDYDQARVTVTKLQNCSDNLPEFTSLMQDARQKRRRVNTDVLTIDKILDPSIKNKITDLYNNLLESESSEGTNG